MRLPKPKIGKKGQASPTDAILSLIVMGALLFVGALIMQELSSSFEADFTGGEFEGVYNETVNNTETGMNLMTIVLILLAAGALLSAIYAFVRPA